MLTLIRRPARFSRSVQIFSKEKSTDNHTNTTSSSSSSSSDDEKTKVNRKIPDQRVIDRLNELLLRIPSTQDLVESETINLARPIPKRVKKIDISDSEKNSKEPVEKQVIKAASDVAKLIGGADVEQTESELLSRLLTPTDKPSGSTVNDLIKGMKIEQEQKPPENYSRAMYVRQLLDKGNARPTRSFGDKFRRRSTPRFDKTSQEVTFTPVDLFGGQPLGIFTTNDNLKVGPTLSTWKKIRDKQLKLAITHPPANYFQQMILWTKQGKLWKFPIDNEYGLEDEAETYFTDHIFLEENLESWCPEKGPIRHFMELVCHGLSKNYHLTVAAKREHIEWYRNYFESKRTLLEEIGAYPPQVQTQSTEKNIDNTQT